MYIGDYSHTTAYGLYGNEALLLERRSFALDATGLDSLRALFARGDLNEPLSPTIEATLERLRSASVHGSDSGRCAVLIGRKVTGDMHVPMGAATFVALLDSWTHEAAESVPKQVVTQRRSAHGRQERVARGWEGFGTLAYPGFRHPQWDRGWLVQLAQLDDDDSTMASDMASAGMACPGRRFAFVWRSRRGDAANTLSQVAAQSSAVFVGENEAMRPYWPPAAASSQWGEF